MGKVLDIVFEGIDFTKLVIIISDQNKEIAESIQELQKGVTGIYGRGMYTEKEKLVLVCATPRRDVGKILRTAKQIDSNSFIIISNAREVYGEGFK